MGRASLWFAGFCLCTGLGTAASADAQTRTLAAERYDSWGYRVAGNRFSDRTVFSQIGTVGTSGPDRYDWARLYLICDVSAGPAIVIDSKSDLHSRFDDVDSGFEVQWDESPPLAKGSIESWEATVVGRVGLNHSTRVVVPETEWAWLIDGMAAYRRLRIRIERQSEREPFVLLDFPLGGFSEAFSRLDCFR